jgi:nucleoside 2-deoxyribosyltransferase
MSFGRATMSSAAVASGELTFINSATTHLDVLLKDEAMSKRIYLAGPEVFLPNAIAVGAEKKRLAAEAGFVACFPLDTAVSLDGLPDHEKARRIYAACEDMMRTCDLAIANCTPFRGVSMDSGTAFEIGFMRALGRPVFGYSNAPGSLAERSARYRQSGLLPWDCDRPMVEIENFDHVENLMIAVAIERSGGTLAGSADAAVDMADLCGFKRCLAEAKGFRARG